LPSHHSESEAREKLQGFVAHYVWLDEMPGSIDIIEELQRRVQSRHGYFLATFTPKVKNDEIKKLIEASKEPASKKYKMPMFDNPSLTQMQKDNIIQSLATYPEAQRRTICLVIGRRVSRQCTILIQVAM
jgi:phage terminase large subunit-like protein